MSGSVEGNVGAGEGRGSKKPEENWGPAYELSADFSLQYEIRDEQQPREKKTSKERRF